MQNRLVDRTWAYILICRANMMSAFVSFILSYLTLSMVHFLPFTLKFDRAVSLSHRRFMFLNSESKVDVTIQNVFVKCDKWGVAY